MSDLHKRYSLSHLSPAFPTVMPGFCNEGMTLRQWYAGQALAGLCANTTLTDIISKNFNNTPTQAQEYHAIMAVAFADALLAELAKEKA